jgi:hypothetical protein
LLYHVCAVASRNIRFARCGTSGKLTLWRRYVLLQIATKLGLSNNNKEESIILAGSVPTQAPIQCVLGAVSLWVKRLTNDLQLVPMSRKHESILPPPHACSWRNA